VTGTLHDDQYTFLITSRSVLSRIKTVSKHTFYVKFFFLFENLAVFEICGEYCTAEQATDDNVAHAHCMLDT